MNPETVAEAVDEATDALNEMRDSIDSLIETLNEPGEQQSVDQSRSPHEAVWGR